MTPLGVVPLNWLPLVLAFALGSCSAPPTPVPTTGLNLGIENGTSLAVTLLVNGRRITDVAAHGGRPTIDVSGLPPLPWIVEARSPSGRLLTSMIVKPGEVQSTTAPDGVGEHTGTFGRVDLSCGRLTIWAGDVRPSGPPPTRSPGSPGDCQP